MAENTRRPTGTDRRDFLKTSALAVGAASLPGTRLPAEARRRKRGGALSHPVLITVFQRGGADQLQLYAPTGDSQLDVLRPNIAVGAPGSGAAVEGLAMDATFSMHPSMSALHSRYVAASSDVALVHAVGYVPPSRSHFQSQDIFEAADFTQGPNPTTGWINRHLQATATANDALVRGLALRKSTPLSMRGTYPTFAFNSLTDLMFPGAADVRATLENALAAAGAPSSPTREGLYQSVEDSFALIDHFSGIDPATYSPQNGAVYPGSDLGNKLKEAAQLIREDLGVEIIAMDQGGWDHHSDIVARVPIFASDLSACLSALASDLGPLMSEVMVTVMSEFGREVQENGSAGTDHGVGGAMVVMGGAAQGGQVHGTWPGLSALYEGRFLEPSNDFRDVLFEVLDDHLGGTDPTTVLPGHTPNPLGII